MGGSEYRNLVGFPGGATNKAMYTELLEASLRTGDRVDFGKGKGNDADAKALVWVMDSIEYPFHVAEPYHQFHDGFRLEKTTLTITMALRESFFQVVPSKTRGALM